MWVADALDNEEIPGPAGLPLKELMVQLSEAGLITLA